MPDTSKWKPNTFANSCLAKGYSYLITSCSDYFPELCFSDTVLHHLDTLINHAIIKHHIPNQNVFIGGMSASGTRALKYTEFSAKGKSSFNHKIAGVFAVDPPLDLQRFYNSVFNADSLIGGMAAEAELMRTVFKDKMGNPKGNWIKFYETSVYTYTHFVGGNASYYMDVPIILFHEPDLDWWWKERGARYFDINSIDIDRFQGYLVENGKDDITVVKTSGKGFDNYGNRKCHSWSIVDEDQLINWILKYSELN